MSTSSELERYILGYPNFSNAELARLAKSENYGSTVLSQYATNSLKNYFGKMRKELENTPTKGELSYEGMSNTELRNAALSKLIAENPTYTVRELVDFINAKGLVIGSLDIRATYANSSLTTYVGALKRAFKNGADFDIDKDVAFKPTQGKSFVGVNEYSLDFSKCSEEQIRVAEALVNYLYTVSKDNTEVIEELYGYGVEFYDNKGDKVNMLFIGNDLAEVEAELEMTKLLHMFYIFDDSVGDLNELEKGDHTSYRMLHPSYHLYDAILDAISYVNVNQHLHIVVHTDRHTPGTCNTTNIETIKFMIEHAQENHDCHIDLVLPEYHDESLLDSFEGFKFKHIVNEYGEILA
jgi:hypothetical protein